MGIEYAVLPFGTSLGEICMELYMNKTFSKPQNTTKQLDF